MLLDIIISQNVEEILSMARTLRVGRKEK